MKSHTSAHVNSLKLCLSVLSPVHNCLRSIQMNYIEALSPGRPSFEAKQLKLDLKVL
jgi:GTP1/Obg family GTP-binding protein